MRLYFIFIIIFFLIISTNSDAYERKCVNRKCFQHVKVQESDGYCGKFFIGENSVGKSTLADLKHFRAFIAIKNRQNQSCASNVSSFDFVPVRTIELSDAGEALDTIYKVRFGAGVNIISPNPADSNCLKTSKNIQLLEIMGQGRKPVYGEDYWSLFAVVLKGDCGELFVSFDKRDSKKLSVFVQKFENYLPINLDYFQN
jgi:hypothetical protein